MKRIYFIFFAIIFSFSCSHKIDIKDYNEYSHKLVKQELYKEALFYLKKAEKENNNNYKLKNNIAICYEGLGKIEKAEKYYEEALKIKKEKPVEENYESFKKNH